VRLLDSQTKDSVVFDATLTDEHGDELATIENFVMRKVAANFTQASSHRTLPVEATSAGRRPETPSEMALREGMTPAEGLDALDRVMRAEFSPQVVACTMPLQPWLDRLAAEARGPGGADGQDQIGPVFTRPSVSATYAAPRDEVEKELAGLWQSLLGVAEVGINDDFFELGGQSLVAVRLFQRVSKKYGVDLPLSTLFQAPTIADCASLLRETLGVPQPGNPAPTPSNEGPELARSTPATFSHLVAIQRGSDRVPFFCIHGAGGNVLNFRDLARAMHPDQPFYGLQAAGIDGVNPPHRSIEEMAEAYLTEIRTFQPAGPYLLGGYSGGGVIAYEIAQRLTALGEKVGLLAFIDTFHPRLAHKNITLFTRLERLQREGVAYVKEAIIRQRRAAQSERDDRAIEGHLERGEPIPFNLRELYLWRLFERAMAQYDLRPYQGTATLFRAAAIDHFFGGGGESYGWDRDVLGGVNVVQLPGHHSSLLLGTNAELLVRRLNEEIARATSQHNADEAHGPGQRFALERA